ncbi:hypothetical protein OC846_002176 [Tilletia horrida]|uniref:Aminotransferase class I/classII large domain-containing protein n=1 Tax=Tilletia horrida TaxID=155126 RepID=A0AAN6GRX5_9BASI|nr:hypothetical protein OC845_004252 [Tilletia horrida]KAK0554293.1 hypothetical protein OC846_002176 [Tilletia horrida]KAK0563384.1 hypothetical protein OC861_004833 [Tilletia horrida]
MVKFETFGVERWMDEWQPRCTFDLAETCASSLTIEELLKLGGADLFGLPKQRMVYGDIRGSDKLRDNIASLYEQESGTKRDNILITQGAIGANFLVFLSLISAASNVVVAHPTYQQLYGAPKALGAKVLQWKQSPKSDWQHKVDDLIPLLTKDTSLVVVNNPKNPTGTFLSGSELESIVKAVQEHASPDCIILSDEVYRPLYHSLGQGEEMPPSMLEVGARLGFPNVIATGSLSKAFALAGLRVGWIATPRTDLIDLFADTRDYNVISVSMLDDYLAGIALEPATREGILKRNCELARTNREDVAAFVQSAGLQWTAPKAGTTAFIRLPDGTDDVEFCRELALQAKVLLCPGTYFDWPGYVRLGYANEREQFKQGLVELKNFMKQRAQ